MTHKATQHRKMEVRSGRVITKKRWRFIRAYTQRRLDHGQHRGPPNNVEYLGWVEDFERFMINGLGERPVG